jgi:hypothetical protein
MVWSRVDEVLAVLRILKWWPSFIHTPASSAEAVELMEMTSPIEANPRAANRFMASGVRM